MLSMGDKLNALVHASHLAAMNGEPHVENELNEIDDMMNNMARKLNRG